MIANIIRFFSGVVLSALLVAPAAGQPAPRWQPTERNNPNKEDCRKIWRAIGLPTYKRRIPGRIIACHDRYVVSYNAAAKSPDWVLEHLTGPQLNNANLRPRIGFSKDDFLPPQHQPIGADYDEMPNNFEIGHMAPSEDFSNSAPAMRDTFLFSNAVPQVGDRFNAAIWKRLEREARSAAVERGEVYVITGPVRTPGNRLVVLTPQQNKCRFENKLNGPSETHVCAAGSRANPRRGCNEGIVVPVAIYKIIYDPGRHTAYAFLMANRNHDIDLGNRTHDYLNGFRVHVAAVENLTGLRLFRGLPAAMRTKVRTKCEQEQLWAAELVE